MSSDNDALGATTAAGAVGRNSDTAAEEVDVGDMATRGAAERQGTAVEEAAVLSHNQEGLTAEDGLHVSEPLVSKQAQLEDGEDDEKLLAAALPPLPHFWRECWQQLDIGMPIAGTYFLDYSMNLISLAFVGRLGTLELAATSMATSIGNVTGFSLLEGLASAIETIGGQAFGAGMQGDSASFKTVGRVAQRAHLLLSAICIPIAFTWLNLDAILMAMRQDAEISRLSRLYLMLEIPGLFAMAAFIPLIKFMQVQGVTAPLALISLCSLLFHFLANLVAVTWLDLGLPGAAIAYSCTAYFQLLLAIGYLFRFDPEGVVARCWPKWDLRSAAGGWGEYLTIAVPACAMICLEWWYFETLIIMSGWLPQPDISVAALSISLQIVAISYMLPLAFGIATSVRVGNELGANRPGHARSATVAAVALALVFGAILAALQMLMRDTWTGVFTGGGGGGGGSGGGAADGTSPRSFGEEMQEAKTVMLLQKPESGLCGHLGVEWTLVAGLLRKVLDGARMNWGAAGRQLSAMLSSASGAEVVSSIVSKSMPVVAVAQFVTGVSASLQGALRGSRRQTEGTIINAVIFYLVALPASVVVAFPPIAYGVLGFWVGMAIGMVSQVFALGALLWRTDWKLEAQRAFTLVASEQGLVQSGGDEEALQQPLLDA